MLMRLLLIRLHACLYAHLYMHLQTGQTPPAACKPTATNYDNCGGYDQLCNVGLYTVSDACHLVQTKTLDDIDSHAAGSLSQHVSVELVCTSPPHCVLAYGVRSVMIVRNLLRCLPLALDCILSDRAPRLACM